jgi:molybdopterin-guanine dinucleotide biosynthesis protein A
VLAGGEGKRFGGPKATARVAGRSLVSRAVDTLGGVVESVVVVSSRPVGPVDVPVLPDRTSGAGPLAGLESALVEAEGRGLDGVFLLACDLPLVGEGLIRTVAEALGGGVAVAPARSGGGVEPLCAAWSVAVLPAARAALASDDRSLHALFRTVGGRALAPEKLAARGHHPFLNVNTQDDRARAEAALAEGDEP